MGLQRVDGRRLLTGGPRTCRLPHPGGSVPLRPPPEAMSAAREARLAHNFLPEATRRTALERLPHICRRLVQDSHWNLCPTTVKIGRSPFFEMKKITIAAGSKRGPKLNAITDAHQSFSAALARDTQFEVVGVEVESGVSHTPTSRDELMRGARQRAEALQQTARQGGADWQYFVGLEGGLDVVCEGASADKIFSHSGLQQ